MIGALIQLGECFDLLDESVTRVLAENYQELAEPMTHFRTTTELAADAMKALRESREPPQEHFARLVSLGWINRQGEVTRLLGGDAEPELDSDPAKAANAKKKKRPRRP